MPDQLTLGFIDNVIKTLAWPIVAGLAIILFRKQIVDKVPHLSELTLPGGFAVKFGDELAETKQIGNKALKEQNNKPMTLHTFLPDDPIHISAEIDPQELIVSAFYLVDKELVLLFSTIHGEGGSLQSGALFMYELRKNGKISEATYLWFLQLRHLRNLAEHSPPGTLSSQDAVDYRFQCVTFVELVSQVLQESQPKSEQSTLLS
jgi:hypothetical protein